MDNTALYSQLIEKNGICVVIPTYNNAGTLPAVINDVLLYTQHVIVIDDGSTDATADVLKNYPFIHCISCMPNRGKGNALKLGLRFAIEKGYNYAITIDSDGQHFAKDIPVFVDHIIAHPGSLIIGSRNMNQESVPGKSSFGNRFSNFWYRVETGIKAPDTQSGYRLYPLQPLKSMRFYTGKYEFEIEVIVRAAWKGVPVSWVPVTVYYAPEGERISHFRPFKDFFRISVLNTVLVLVTFLYIKPRDFIRMLLDKQKRKKFIDEYLLHPHESDVVKAVSVGVGIFMGIIPIWGFQLVTAIALAFVLKLNKALVIIAANISIPPMIPFIIYGSFAMGALWMGDHAMPLSFSNQLDLSTIGYNLQQYIYGSITLAFIAALISGVGTYAILKISKAKRKKAERRKPNA